MPVYARNIKNSIVERKSCVELFQDANHCIRFQPILNRFQQVGKKTSTIFSRMHPPDLASSAPH
ncbi:unnamed protein product [Laminaria digitata]